MCDMPHSYVCTDSSLCVTWLSRMSDIFHSGWSIFSRVTDSRRSPDCFLGALVLQTFQNARNFQNIKVSFTCTVERSHKSPTSIFSQPIFLSKREILD